MNPLVFQALAEAAHRNEPVALGVLSAVKGSSPQTAGAKALFYADGRIRGTLGGGCLEAEVQRRALQALRDGRPARFELLLDHDFGWDDGLICGGKVAGVILPQAQACGEAFWSELAARRTPIRWGIGVDFAIRRFAPPPGPSAATGAVPSEPECRLGEPLLYEETVTPPCVLWIAGAGHIAQAVARLALQLDFAVAVFDDRPALANPQFFPPETALCADTWDRLLALPLPDRPCFGLVATRGHRHDALVLQSWLHRPFAFLGMLGSGRKVRTIREHFIAEGLATAAQLDRLVCPVGIRIRSQSVMEIAVSIAAQLIDRRAEIVGPAGAT